MPRLPPPALVPLLLAMALLVPVAARAQEPACGADTVGLVACVAGKLCACRFARGGAATGLPDGFRWDCGVLRPRCGEPVPATSDPYLGPLPEALSIERNTNIIRNRNDIRNRVGENPWGR
jgi:hypothetical protein